MGNCKPVTTPMVAHFKLSAKSGPTSTVEIKTMSHVPYSSAVGSLMYAMVYARLELAYAISTVSRYMHNPEKVH